MWKIELGPVGSRYELGTSIPPADALKAIADALGVSADFLLSDDYVLIKDKELLKKFEAIQEIEGDDKNVILNFLDMAIRDHKAKKAYSNWSKFNFTTFFTSTLLWKDLVDQKIGYCFKHVFTQ